MFEVSGKTIAFKTAVITDEIDQDFIIACDLASQFSIDAVEIRSVYERDPFEFTSDDISYMKKILEKKGLKVCAISSPFFKCEMDDTEEIKRHLQGLRHCIKLADKLGTELIRGFTFWAKSESPAQDNKSSVQCGKRLSPGNFDPRAIADRFEEAVKILDESGKTLVLESDPSVNATNAQMVVQVIEAVGSSRVLGLWDPGNDIWDPREEIPFPDGYNFIKKYMRHVHLKDVSRKSGKREAVPIGQGDVDWENQFHAFIADGYSGYISLETHYRRAKKLSEKQLNMPKGTVFSFGGFEATRESLELWRNMLCGFHSKYKK